MESLLSLFIFHDSYVVSFLVMGITVTVVALLLFNHKSPESVIKSEVGGSENIEGALRRVLGEQRWMQASQSPATDADGNPNRADELEKEILDKDRKIAELNKKLTQSSSQGHSAMHAAAADNSELLSKIAELEGRLKEYEVIEDDIADLSLYRVENDKLKAELARLKGQLGGEGETNAPAEELPAAQPELKVVADAETKISGPNLVAEFEKVVIHQSKLEGDNESIVVKSSPDSGKTVVTEIKQIHDSNGSKSDVHSKLQNITPDSKEEAEIFISELKSIKKG